MKLTDEEYRIFLSAMDREEKICKEIDKKPGAVCLVDLCKSIKKKVKENQHKRRIYYLTSTHKEYNPKTRDYESVNYVDGYGCPVCKSEFDFYLGDKIYKYCPWCGTRLCK